MAIMTRVLLQKLDGSEIELRMPVIAIGNAVVVCDGIYYAYRTWQQKGVAVVFHEIPAPVDVSEFKKADSAAVKESYITVASAEGRYRPVRMDWVSYAETVGRYEQTDAFEHWSDTSQEAADFGREWAKQVGLEFK